jgi:hypothetical protein
MRPSAATAPSGWSGNSPSCQVGETQLSKAGEFAPKGPNRSAQGNALGPRSRTDSEPCKGEPRPWRCIALSGLNPVIRSDPRALPWADLWLPLRGDGPRCRYRCYSPRSRTDSQGTGSSDERLRNRRQNRYVSCGLRTSSIVARCNAVRSVDRIPIRPGTSSFKFFTHLRTSGRPSPRGD